MAASLGGDIVIDGKRFVIFRSKDGKHQWERLGGVPIQEGDVEQEVTARWNFGWPGGMGEGQRTGPDSLGYAYSVGVDCSVPGVARLAPTRKTYTPSTAPTDSPTFFLEGTSADTSRFYYALNDRYAHKMKISSNTLSAVGSVEDAGANAAAGRPGKFETAWHIAWGDAVDLEILTIANEGSGDTWNADDGNVKAIGLTNEVKGDTAYLVRAANKHKVSECAATGATLTFASEFEVGDSSYAITDLGDTGVVLCVAKENNLFIYDQTGACMQVTRFHPESGDTNTSVCPIHGTEAALYSHPGGLMLMDGDNIDAVGPDEIPTNREIPNVTHEPHRGRHHESAVSGDWIWNLYRVVESGSTKTYLMAGYRTPEGGIIWHTIDRYDFAARGVHPTSDNWILITGGTVIQAQKIGPNGAPDAGRDNVGYGETSATTQLYLPETDFGLPMTLKQLRAVDVLTRDLAADRLISIRGHIDGGSEVTIGDNITDAGASTVHPGTLGTDDNGYRFRFVPTFVTSSGYTPANGTDPQLLGVIARAVVRPDRAYKVRVLLDCEAAYSSGAGQIKSPESIRSSLIAHEEGAPVTGTTPEGTATTMKIKNVGDIVRRTNFNGVTTYVLQVDLTEFVNA